MARVLVSVAALVIWEAGLAPVLVGHVVAWGVPLGRGFGEVVPISLPVTPWSAGTQWMVTSLSLARTLAQTSMVAMAKR